MIEELAMAQMSARRDEAHTLRQAQDLARAQRLNRKEEKAAQRARLALTRNL